MHDHVISHDLEIFCSYYTLSDVKQSILHVPANLRIFSRASLRRNWTWVLASKSLNAWLQLPYSLGWIWVAHIKKSFSAVNRYRGICKKFGEEIRLPALIPSKLIVALLSRLCSARSDSGAFSYHGLKHLSIATSDPYAAQFKNALHKDDEYHD